MTDEELIAQWDEQMETARAALEQAFKIADAMADRIDAYAERERIATDARRKSEARAERLEARCKALIAAYDKVNWMRTADYHGDLCSCLRCHFDHLRADLKGADHE